jgi:hypothetical protein
MMLTIQEGLTLERITAIIIAQNTSVVAWAVPEYIVTNFATVLGCGQPRRLTPLWFSAACYRDSFSLA